ncbi:MAG TPA: copper resistance protein NlpE N-terminal domain-containing protein, partial [Chitinophagaceae bacterium]|nr:copper resistance protein NlpE N-terminal domain-containing protein [Chitinophagaceae bacterium]
MKIILCAIIFLTASVFSACNNAGSSNPGVDSIPEAPDTFVSLQKINTDTSLSLTPGDNSMTSLDWNGTYKGVTPCADCEGIETTLKLNLDKTYALSTKYLGKKEARTNMKSGSFEWSADGSTVNLKGITNSPSQYKVGENKLFQLDMQGKMIEGALASKYILTKQTADTATLANAPITDTYWKLTELLGKPVDTTIKRKPLFIQFDQAGKVTGSGGCNNISGTYTADPNGKLTLSKMISTRMACPAMQDESAFLQALSKVTTYII